MFRVRMAFKAVLLVVLLSTMAYPAVAQGPETAKVSELQQVTDISKTVNATRNPKRDNVAKAVKDMAASDQTRAEARSVFIIRLDEPAVAMYEGGVSGLRPTSRKVTGAQKLDMANADSKAYASHLHQQRANFIDRMNQLLGRNVNVTYEYYVTLNGLAVELTAKEAVAVAALPNVSYIQPDRQFETQTVAGPAWIGAQSIWEGSDGVEGTFGEGVIVGIIDTGINPDNPSFTDIGGDGYDHENPFGSGNYVGVCDPNDPSFDDTFPCNDKLIGAWGYPTVNGGDPTDPDGHGSHTASTAAGNFVNGAIVNTPNGFVVEADISGVAPHANIIAYAACCTGSALAAARDQIVIDGVDVVNYSIGASSPTPAPWDDSFALQWLAVREAGIFVATSAGNSGNGFATLGSPSDLPWMTVVGASTHDVAYLNALVDMSGGATPPPADIAGRSVSVGYGPAAIVYAGDFGDALCQNPFAAGTFSGEIVVCDRGAIARVGKGANVQAGGAGGMILAEVTPGGLGALAADTHVLPAVHITTADGDALKAWLADGGTGHMGTIVGTTLDQNDSHADFMAKFSSRGPNGAIPSILKPDVVAPGVGIMAAYHDGVEFDIIQGTSMASPHAAGAAALLKALHPDWTPGQIESAMMMTALSDVLDDDAASPADPFTKGAGRVDLTQASKAALLMDETIANFEDANPDVGGDPSTLNIPSLGQGNCVGTCSWTRTVTNQASFSTSWSVSTSTDDGLSLSVSPDAFSLDAGESQVIEVTANLTNVPEGTWVFGQLNLTEDNGAAPTSHMAVGTQSSLGSLPDDVGIVTRRNAGSHVIADVQAIEITDMTIDVNGLVKGEETSLALVSDPTNGDPYDGFDPAVDGAFFVTLNVPAGTKHLIAETILSESSDLDLFVGTGNSPSAATQLCQSASASAIEFCQIDDPAPGDYWVVVQNWSSANGPALPGQLMTLVTAVVPGSSNGNMTVEGPSSVPANESFDLTVFWNEPSMQAGDRWYGSFDIGPDGDNPGAIGTVPVTILRVADDVTKTVDFTEAIPGDTLTYEITIQPNILSEPLAYQLTDIIPEGLTYVDGSVTGGAVVENGILTWSGVMAVPDVTYAMTTSDVDASCDTPFGGYVDLESFGLLTSDTISGDSSTFTVNWSSGVPIEYFGVTKAATTNFTDDGFAFFNSTPGASPWVNTPIPTADDPNDLMAIFWKDMEIVYDAATNRGVTLATAGPDLSIIEYDDMEPWPAGATDQRFDFEVIQFHTVDNTPGAYEIFFAYDNINGDLNPVTVGLENEAGDAGVQYAFDDATPETIHNGLVICFDQIGAADPVVITFQATVNVEDCQSSITNTVVHDTDNPGSQPAEASADVAVDCEAKPASNFVLLAHDSILVGRNSDVLSGDVGVYQDSNGPFLRNNAEVYIDTGATFHDNASKVMGDRVILARNASVQDVHYNRLRNRGATILGNEVTPLELPLDVTLPDVPNATPGNTDVFVEANDTVTLDSGSYGKLNTRSNATVTFTGGVYDFNSWQVGPSTQLIFEGPTEIRIALRLRVEDNSSLMPADDTGLTAKDIKIFVLGKTGKARAAHFGDDVTVKANVYAPNGTLRLSRNVTAEGAFYGQLIQLLNGVTLSEDNGF